MNKKTTRTLLPGLLMTSVSAWTIEKGSAFGWVGLVFFGSITILSSIRFFWPDLKWFRKTEPDSMEPTEESKAAFNRIYKDNGIFTFEESGFTVKTTENERNIQWSEVQSMIGYKRDMFAIDNICLDVFCDNDKSFSINEETAGWFRFLDHSKKALTVIDPSWEIEISTPAFETNLTLVYDRQNRPLKEVTDEHYKS